MNIFCEMLANPENKFMIIPENVPTKELFETKAEERDLEDPNFKEKKQ